MIQDEKTPRSYSLTSPSLDGMISDDYLYFEGLRKPSTFSMIRDRMMSAKDIITLEAYWNDMYNLFLRKLTQFAGREIGTDESTLKLQALLQELIKVRALIENASKTAIMSK